MEIYIFHLLPKIRGQHTSQEKKADPWAPVQNKVLFKLKAFLPCRAGRFIYSITVFYHSVLREQWLPSEAGGHLKHVEQNPGLSVFNKPGSARGR